MQETVFEGASPFVDMALQAINRLNYPEDGSKPEYWYAIGDVSKVGSSLSGAERLRPLGYEDVSQKEAEELLKVPLNGNQRLMRVPMVLREKRLAAQQALQEQIMQGAPKTAKRVDEHAALTDVTVSAGAPVKIRRSSTRSD